MKKIIILILALLVVFGAVSFADTQKEENEKKSSNPEFVTKTYILEHVSPSVVRQTLRQYFWESSFDKNGNMFTVKIRKENIPGFEKLLKQLDVERKKILVRIFTVLASHEGKGGPIDNKDLKKVLDELQKVLSFKSFRLDGVSALTVTDGQRHSRLLLSSRFSLSLNLQDICIRQKTGGARSVGFEFSLLQMGEKHVHEGKIVSEINPLIESETSVKEKGYLVAGVSKIGNGDSLVLVINAEIKE